MAADVDTDESSGVEHGFEAIRNAVAGRTNPYLNRELMLLVDPVEKVLDPGLPLRLQLEVSLLGTSNDVVAGTSRKIARIAPSFDAGLASVRSTPSISLNKAPISLVSGEQLLGLLRLICR